MRRSRKSTEVGPTEDSAHLHKLGIGGGLVSAFYQSEESLKNLPWVTEGGRKAQK